MAPRSIWNGAITFGVVTVPIKLYSATESKTVARVALARAGEGGRALGIRGSIWDLSCPVTSPSDDQEAKPMPKVSKESAANQQDYGPVVDHSENVDGYTISFTSFKVDIDSTPMLKGLPNDSCPCPHWGYVLTGRVVFTVDGREEVYEPGDAFYVPPGHLQRADAGTEYLQFSPADELDRVSEHMQRRMQEMQGS